ncbi:MAG: hypothetical protein IJ563_00965, partial [Selenomonadaceae bacterium]|nr:hypothetical protein [Selenomonadaceae bacterium]
FNNRQSYIGMFSTLKYMISTNDQKMRDNFFNYKLERGFIFSSQNFQGCKGKFPVGFIIWNLFNQLPLNEQKISLDVYNSQLEKIAVKTFRPVNQNDLLSKWFKRPRNVEKFPPMSSALNIGYKNKDRNDKTAKGFLASLMCTANDFSHQNYISLLSGPYVSHSGHSITEKIFEQSLMIHTVRRLPKATWLNDRDQFMQPTKELPREFITDAVIWSLFSNSNNTAAISNVEYEGSIYQIKNNFYPFLLSVVDTWYCSDADIRQSIQLASIRNDDRFAARWIKNNNDILSQESIKVIGGGVLIYKDFYAKLNQLNRPKFKIDTWDAGWYQIRMSLNDANLLDDKLNSNFQSAMKALGDKLLPQIYDLGFLQNDITLLD